MLKEDSVAGEEVGEPIERGYFLILVHQVVQLDAGGQDVVEVLKLLTYFTYEFTSCLVCDMILFIL